MVQPSSASRPRRPAPSPPLALAAALLLAVAPAAAAAAPIVCPPGTTLKGGEPPERFEAWCEGRPDAHGTPRRHGPARHWYDDGAPRVEEHWVEGRRDGAFVELHRNGRQARAGSYARDDKVGTWTIWYEDGGLEERTSFERDVPHGPFTSWYRGGKKRAEGRFCHRAQCGTWISYDEAGREVGRVEYGEQRGAP